MEAKCSVCVALSPYCNPPQPSPSPLTLTREAADKVAEAVSPATDAVKSVWEEVTGWLKG